MNGFTFDKVDLLLVEPDLNARQGIRTILHNNGFRDLKQVSSIAEATEVLVKRMPDLMICSIVLPDGDFYEFMRALRHHEVGNNPFLPVIGLIGDPRPEVISKAIDSGADDLVMKPISTAQLIDRIRKLVTARRPFVVTTDYVGPRRRGMTENGSTPEVEVPNTLKAKAKGEKVDYLMTQMAIDQAVGTVNNHKMEKYAAEIISLVNTIAPRLANDPIDPIAWESLPQLLFIAEDTGRRVEASGHAHVSDLCRTMLDLTKRVVEADGRHDPRDVKLMRPLSQAIMAGITGGPKSAEAARQILATLSKS